MKKSIFLLASAFAMLSGFSSTATAEAQGPAYFKIANVAADDMLNIRAKRDHKSQRIGRIPPNATCVQNLIVERAYHPWVKIKYAGVIGWVNSRYLDGSEDPSCQRTGPIAAHKQPSTTVTASLQASAQADASLPIAKTEPITAAPEASDFAAAPTAKSDNPSTSSSNTASRNTDSKSRGELLGYVGVVNISADEHLNVRAQPTASAKKIGELRSDETCIRITRSNDDRSWVYVEHQSLSGWVSADYLGSVDKYDCFLKFPRGL